MAASTRSFVRSALLVPLVAGLSFAPLQGQVDVNISLDSTDPVTATKTLNLFAGWYSIGVFGGAWNPFGFVSGCVANGSCAQGWQTGFQWNAQSGQGGYAGYAGQWATGPLATANAPDPFLVFLSQPAILGLTLTLPDNNYADNFGTLVVNVASAQAPTVVPEPATVVLMGTGLLGLAAFARRRRVRGDGLDEEA